MPSTVIRRFHYHPAEQRLTVLFQSERCYDYLDVPAEVPEEMEKAYSKGEFFNAKIRDKFRFNRVR